MPQISTKSIYPEKQKTRRPSKNTPIKNGTRCWTQHPAVSKPSRSRWQPSTSSLLPCQFNAAKGCHLFHSPIPKSLRFSQCWQSTPKNEPSFPTYSKINDIGRDPMRDPSDMATIPKQCRNKTPLQRPEQFGDVVHFDIVYGSGSAIGGYRYSLWFVNRRSKHI